MKRLLMTGLVVAISLTQANATTYKWHHGKLVEDKGSFFSEDGRHILREQRAKRKAEAPISKNYIPPKVYASQAPIIKKPPVAAIATSTPITAKEADKLAYITPIPRDSLIYSTEGGAYVGDDDDISKAIEKLSERAKLKQGRVAGLNANQAKAEVDAFSYDSFRAEDQAKAYKRDQMFAAKPDVRIGMTAKQVTDGSKWGAPIYKSTTINTTGKFETWFYGGKAWLSLRGGKVTSINY